MNTIGCRLREERERLGLSQAAFGEIGGVKKLSQLNYEKDVREPGTNYLRNIETAGADIEYILTGHRDTDQRKLLISKSLVIDLIALSLGINFRSFDEAVEYASNQPKLSSSDMFLLDPTSAEITTLQQLIDSAINQSKKVVNFDLLESLISKFEQQLIEHKLTIQPVKKAAAIKMLFDSFLSAGRIDEKTIAYTIKLLET